MVSRTPPHHPVRFAKVSVLNAQDDRHRGRVWFAGRDGVWIPDPDMRGWMQMVFERDAGARTKTKYEPVAAQLTFPLSSSHKVELIGLIRVSGRVRFVNAAHSRPDELVLHFYPSRGALGHSEAKILGSGRFHVWVSAGQRYRAEVYPLWAIPGYEAMPRFEVVGRPRFTTRQKSWVVRLRT